MKTFFIGIDPGKNGGIAYIDTYEDYQVTERYSDDVLIELCRDIYNNKHISQVICCLEKVNAMPGQGVVSTFAFGVNFGNIQGILKSHKIPYQEIAPKKWKKEFGLNSEKKKSIEVCKRLFPNVSLMATPKSRKPHDGMAEALLMAEYARRKL